MTSKILDLSGLMLLLALTGCADPARNLYEGIQLHKDIQQTPQDRDLKPTPSYDQYKREIPESPQNLRPTDFI